MYIYITLHLHLYYYSPHPKCGVLIFIVDRQLTSHTHLPPITWQSPARQSPRTAVIRHDRPTRQSSHTTVTRGRHPTRQSPRSTVTSHCRSPAPPLLLLLATPPMHHVTVTDVATRISREIRPCVTNFSRNTHGFEVKCTFSR